MNVEDLKRILEAKITSGSITAEEKEVCCIQSPCVSVLRTAENTPTTHHLNVGFGPSRRHGGLARYPSTYHLSFGLARSTRSNS